MQFPEELTSLNQWLCWRFIQKPGQPKPAKVPFYATTGKPRSGAQGHELDRAHLVDFETASERAALSGYDGIGFAFLPGDGLIGIDLDGCFNTEDADRIKRAEAIISACASWAEYSPSGNGAHIIVRGQTETFKSNALGIEVFCGSQFFTMTGRPLPGAPAEIREIGPETLEKLRRTVKGREPEKAAPAPAQPPQMGAAAKLESALAMISPDLGYEDWLRIGMAIHAELGPGALDVWDRWSSRGTKYQGSRDLESHWRSFKPGAVTGGTLYHMAMQHGWRPPVAPKPAPPVQRPASVDPETGEIFPAVPEPQPANDNAPEVWSEPMDVFGVRQPPELSLDLLPSPFRAYVADQAALTGCDPAIIGLGAVVAAAACITDEIKLQPKARDITWHEHPRLWVAFVGDPSTKKSPAISKAVRHVKRLDHRMAEENAAAMADYKWQHDGWKEAKKADKTNPPPEPKAPPERRLLVEDITVEKLSDVLKDNPRGVLTLKDELTGWFAGMDAYKGSGGKGASMDRAHWLEAYNGGRRTIDRVTRGTVTIPNWSTCIIGGIQPDMMRSIGKSMGNDGLLQRFMVVVARSAVEDEDRTPDMSAMRQYSDLFDHLASLQGGQDATTLCADAQECRRRVSSYARKLASAFDNPHMKAWLGKWDGLFGRLAITYHTIECAAEGIHPATEQVSMAIAQQVERLMCGYLLHHAIHFYNEILDGNDRQEHVRQLARLILARKFERLSKRDIMLYWKAATKMDWWQVRAVVEVLCTMSWLDPEPGAIDTDGKPRAWLVNPKAHSTFEQHAENERERRKAASETLRQMWQTYK